MRVIECGYIQKEIVDLVYKYQKEVEEKKCIIVGVNEFVVDEFFDVEIFKVDLSIRDKQIERFKKFCLMRDSKKVEEFFDKFRKVVEIEDENFMFYIIEVYRYFVMFGEVIDVFREVWGEYRVLLIF